MATKRRKVSRSYSRALNKLLALINRPKHTIDPEDNLLIGARAILSYLELGDRRALEFWFERYGLPVVKRPDNGQWMTSITAIDHWLFMLAAAEARKRTEAGQLRSDEEYNRLLKYRQTQQDHHAKKESSRHKPDEGEDAPNSGPG